MSIKTIFSRAMGNLPQVIFGALIIIIFLFALIHYELRKNFTELNKSHVELKNIVLEQDRKFTILYRNERSDYMDIIPDSMIFWGKLIKFDHLWAKMMFNQILRDILLNKPTTIDVLRRLAFFKRDLIKVFNTHDIDHDALYVIAAESGAYHLAVSKAKSYLRNGGAVGNWQWMYKTALDFGVKMSKNIDMRRDTWYMSKPFCDYIIELRAKTGSIETALRSYNSGSNAYMRAAKKQSWVKDPWFVDLNLENNLYLYYNLAWKFIYENTAKCGLEFREDDFFSPPTVNIQVRLARNTKLKFIELGELIQRDAFELEILNSGHISRTNGFRSIVAERNKRYTTYSLRLPTAVDLNVLQAANESKGKPAAIKGVTFLVNDLINKNKKD